MREHAFIVDDAAAMRARVTRGAGDRNEPLADARSSDNLDAASAPDGRGFDLILADVAAPACFVGGAIPRPFVSEDVHDVTHPMLR